MTRFLLKVEYDGTEFAGFQLQGQGERTIQGALEAAIEQLTGRFCRVHGAGRTDAGVHATGQVIHFDSDWRGPVERMPVALNGMLPGDLVVKQAWIVGDRFHSRFNASARAYRYVILNRVTPSALLSRYALHVREPLNVVAMQAAAAELVGTHDFATFGLPDKPGKATVRRITEVRVRPWKDCILITVRGNAFLRQMVRAFVGTLLMAGKGKLTADDVRRIRESRDRMECPPVAPAQGLYLVQVTYGGDRPQLNDEEQAKQESEL